MNHDDRMEMGLMKMLDYLNVCMDKLDVVYNDVRKIDDRISNKITEIEMRIKKLEENQK